MTTHPTRTIPARVTCLVEFDGEVEITVHRVDRPQPYADWRFIVASAADYPLGAIIELTVPA
jgi:hypothetical protein